MTINYVLIYLHITYKDIILKFETIVSIYYNLFLTW
nr:hypothetical protein RU987_pgp147 [Laurencia catarinensis]WMP12433.1 hypothetical protein [Laurencia catarinensis]